MEELKKWVVSNDARMAENYYYTYFSSIVDLHWKTAPQKKRAETALFLHAAVFFAMMKKTEKGS